MDESYYHFPPVQSDERERLYGERVHKQLRAELGLLKAIGKRDLGFDYELKLSRSLRKLRRKLGYGR